MNAGTVMRECMGKIMGIHSLRYPNLPTKSQAFVKLGFRAQGLGSGVLFSVPSPRFPKAQRALRHSQPKHGGL